MRLEYEALLRNGTWELVECLSDINPIGSKWVYITQMDNYNAHVVAKSYDQQEGIDYIEIFPPLVKVQTIRVILTLDFPR